MNQSLIRPFENIKKAEPIYAVEKITPEYAKEILENHNTGNRKVRENNVFALAEAIKKGQWEQATNDAICFDVDGNLLNGQHRFWAVVLSETTVSMLIGRNVPASAFSVMDTGSKRSTGDYLHHNGVSYYPLVATVGRNYLARLTENGKTTAYVSGGRDRTAISNVDVLDFYNANQENLDFCGRVIQNGIVKIVQPGHIAIALFHLLDNGAKMVDVEEFASQISPKYSGGLPSDAPTRVLCKYFTNIRLCRKLLSVQDVVSVTVAAYNDFMMGTKSRNNYRPHDNLQKVRV